MFKKEISEHEARNKIADAAMRQGLFEMLWKFHPDAKLGRPCPQLGDEYVKDELKRLMLGK